MKHLIKPEKLILARKLRKEQTISEHIFWQSVRTRKFMNLKFRRQAVLLGFIVDFYCPKLKLIIEIDGGIHDSQQERDFYREKILLVYGYKIIRFSAWEVENNLDFVFNKLRKFILTLTPIIAFNHSSSLQFCGEKESSAFLFPSPARDGEGLGER